MITDRSLRYGPQDWRPSCGLKKPRAELLRPLCEGPLAVDVVQKGVD
jgi:hypothetical protein